MKSGIQLSGPIEYKKPSVVWELLSRGFVIFLIVFGTAGCFASSFRLPMNAFVVLGVTLFFSLYLGLIFYKEWTKNVGYIFLFILFLFCMFYLFRFVTSGYYAIVNIVNDKIKGILNIPSAMEYGEMITNRDMTVTICISFMALGICTVLNAFISNYMSIIPTMVLTLPFSLLGFYFGLVPDRIYAILLLAGYVAVFAMKRSNHYKANSKDEDFKEREDKQGHHFIYHSNGKIMGQLIGAITIMAIVLLMGIGLFFPSKTIHMPESMKVLRQKPDEVIGKLVNAGLGGFFNRYNGAGGMSNGQLGGVASVNPDYKTDLVVRMAPYSTERIYLRGFVGTSYSRFQWTPATAVSNVKEKLQWLNLNNLAYSQRFMKSANDKNIINARMKITNKDANTEYRYLPYYTNLFSQSGIQMGEDGVTTGNAFIGKSYDVEYTHSKEKVDIRPTYIRNRDNVYLDMPNENVQSVANFCKAANLYNKSLDQVITTLKAYFQENYPYSTRPGITPRNQDFINYFLDKSKTGYCSHFASATTLILRHLGFPARYIEGYVIDYDQMRQGKKVPGEKVSDWFKGKLRLTDSDVVDIEVDDSCAHAWVEVYEKNYGWRVVDTTPSSMESDEDTAWGILGDALGGNSDSRGTGTEGSWHLTGVTRLLEVVAALIVLGFLIRFGIFLTRKSRLFLSFRGVSKNALINQYIYLCSIATVVHDEYAQYKTYTDQMDWFVQQYDCVLPEDFTALLQKAGFSNKELAPMEVKQCKSTMRQLRKRIWRQAKLRKRMQIWRTVR